MEREEGSIPGAIRRAILRRNSTRSLLSFLAMEGQKEKGRRKSQGMPSMWMLS